VAAHRRQSHKKIERFDFIGQRSHREKLRSFVDRVLSGSKCPLATNVAVP